MRKNDNNDIQWNMLFYQNRIAREINFSDY